MKHFYLQINEDGASMVESAAGAFVHIDEVEEELAKLRAQLNHAAVMLVNNSMQGDGLPTAEKLAEELFKKDFPEREWATCMKDSRYMQHWVGEAKQILEIIRRIS